MKGRIRRCPPYLFKRYASRAEAEAAVVRSTQLRKFGVQTPQATTFAGSRLVRFDLIDASKGPKTMLSADHSELPAMMQSLAALHDVKSLDNLQPFQPLQKITSRLSKKNDQVLAPVIMQALDALRGHSIDSCVIHGDLHVGQFLVDRKATGWLIDFDDLAFGDPAADLGNFAAHLATRAETASTAPLAEMQKWLAIVLDAYFQAGGYASAHAAAAYGQLAVVRRVLKLHQTQPGTHVDQLFVNLCKAR